MKSIIISAFPGTGKSWCTKKDSLSFDGVEYIFHDSDSSKFSWIYDEQGNKTDQRNPEFPDNYIAHIRKLVEEENNVIFVSSHEEVRNALIAAGFRFYIVTPDILCHDIYIDNYRERGNDEKFISLIDKNWEKWLTDIKEQAETIDNMTHIIINKYIYMNAVVDYIFSQNFPRCRTAISLYIVGGFNSKDFIIEDKG